MPITSLTQDWREWIRVNLERNCTVASMIDAMVAKDFDLAFAAQCIDTVANEDKPAGLVAPFVGARVDEPFRYEASRIGTANEIRTRDRVVEVQMRMQRPDVLLLRGLLSKDECDELVRRAREKLKPSTTVDRETGENKVIANRTSFGTYFHLEEDPFIATIDRRLADLTNWPVDNSEGLQILNYRVGGEYKPHFDFFPPEEAGSSAHTAEGGQRIASVVMYLNDVEQGGETIFPEITLSISPHQGDAVYFGYFNSQGQVDRLTLHGGSPVLCGEKWISLLANRNTLRHLPCRACIVWTLRRKPRKAAR